MLSKLNVSQVLAVSSDLPVSKVETACDELIAGGCVNSGGGQWSAFDLAVLFLRLTAPHVPMERFNCEIVHATLSGALVDGLIFTDPKELAVWSYTKPLIRHSATTLLEQHLSSLEAGDSEQYDISHIAVYASGSGYCLALTINWDATGNAPVSAVYLFGDPGAYFSGECKPSIPILALTALGDALYRASDQPDQEVTGQGVLGSLLVPGSLSLH